MGKYTSIKALQRFYKAIEHVYLREYLRLPNVVNLRKLLAKDEKRGFPGIIGSID